MKKLIFLFCPLMLVAQVDPAHPAMAFWNVAGVQGYDQESYATYSTITTADDIQTEINAATGLGGRKVVLSAGTYAVSSTISVPDDVYIVGTDKETVIISSSVRNSTVSTDKTATFEFSGTQGSGISNLTIDYDDGGAGTPAKKNSLTDPASYDASLYTNAQSNFIVSAIEIEVDSQHNLISNVTITDSGDSPIVIKGDNNTVINTTIDGCWNKGTGGRGYFEVNGDSNLIKDNTVVNIRHFLLQDITQTTPDGPRYNVVIDNYFEVDVNFHDDDDGLNLIESNTINIPGSHGWTAIETGEFGTHDPPGPDNYIVNNTTFDYRDNSTPLSTTDVIYTHNENTDASGFGISSFIDSGLTMSIYGTFYIPPVLVNNPSQTNGILFTAY